jgi:tRNA(adenine34) deaminase
MLDIYTDTYFMKEAMKQAHEAMRHGEVPVGCVIVQNNVIIARAHNQVELLNDVTAHAEIIAITSASNYIGAKYLTDCSIYITLEPCVMCAAAIGLSQISKLVFAASDNKRGYTCLQTNILHPKTKIISGLLSEESTLLLINFFKRRR